MNRDFLDEMAIQDEMDYLGILVLRDNLVIEVLPDLLGALGSQDETGVKDFQVTYARAVLPS